MRTHKIRVSGCYSGMFEIFQTVDDRENKKKQNDVHFCVRSPRNSAGNIVPLPIDQFTGKHFLKNACGFPMNDILAFESVQSDQLARAVLQRTQILNLPKNADVPLEDQFATIVPSNWSSPAEFVRASQKYAQYAYAKQQDALRAEAARQVVEAAQKKDPENVVNVIPE